MKTIIDLYSCRVLTSGPTRGRREWRWRMRDGRNGKIIGASSEGYLKRAAAVRNVARVTGVGIKARLLVRGRRRSYEFRYDLGRREFLGG